MRVSELTLGHTLNDASWQAGGSVIQTRQPRDPGTLMAITIVADDDIPAGSVVELWQDAEGNWHAEVRMPAATEEPK